MNLSEMTQMLMNIAACTDNYCKYLNKDTKDYAEILGYVLRVYQDKIRNVSSQGVALILIYLKDVDEDDYEKHIDKYKDKVDKIIKSSKTIDEQLKKMDKIKNTIK